MASSRRRAASWSVGVLALSFVLLAPIQCVGWCEDVDETAGVDGRCLTSCTTILGNEAPLGPGWFLVPALLLGHLLLGRLQRR